MKNKLEVIPYNRFWIDCVHNNILAIMKTLDESFAYLPCTLKGIYSLKKNTLSNVSGTECLDIVFEHPDLSPWVSRREITVNASTDLCTTLKELIDEGYYIFVHLDRFFFPGGIEHNRKHFIHPSFIYGYDDEAKVFFHLENCKNISTIDYYTLGYADLTASFAEVLNQQIDIFQILNCYKIEEERRGSAKLAITKSAIIDNLLFFKRNEIEENNDHVQYCGFIGIQEFSKQLDTIIGMHSMEDTLQSFSQLQKITMLQDRHFWILDHLYGQGDLNQHHYDELVLCYSSIKQTWGIFQNKFMKMLLGRKEETFHKDLEELREQLHLVHGMEEQTIEKMLNII